MAYSGVSFRHVVEDDKTFLVVNEPSLGPKIKDFLVQQIEVEEINLNGEKFDGKGRLESRRLKKEIKKDDDEDHDDDDEDIDEISDEL